MSLASSPKRDASASARSDACWPRVWRATSARPISRHVRCNLANFRQRDLFAKSRICQHLFQVGNQARLFVFREKLHIDAEHGVDLEQDRNRQRPLIFSS